MKEKGTLHLRNIMSLSCSTFFTLLAIPASLLGAKYAHSSSYPSISFRINGVELKQGREVRKLIKKSGEAEELSQFPPQSMKLFFLIVTGTELLNSRKLDLKYKK